MTTEDVRVRLRTKLESAFGAEEASLLMDRPPGGWNDLVTNQVLEARLDALRYELVGQMSELRGEMSELRGEIQRGFQLQTWRLLGAIFVAFGMFATLVRVT
jgi:hypothetical protein